jgi:BirA family transcriptional regulator, biotin operon repressor / biotin---[acetyl-CoA-carboxylase] ligase
MMDLGLLQETLSSLPLGAIRFFDSIGSTNDEALKWASQDALDLSLVVSNEQTAGRGRSGRKWFTPGGSALAFSLILRPTDAELEHPTRITGLGALAVTDSLRFLSRLPQIKWPNDILIDGKKVAGILVESNWLGNKLDGYVLGIGVNVLKASVPPHENIAFPATSIEDNVDRGSIDRAELLKGILSELVDWRTKLGDDEFLQAWENSLAFRGQRIIITRDGQSPITGELIGLERSGNLRILTPQGEMQEIHFGEIHLRPVL